MNFLKDARFALVAATVLASASLLAQTRQAQPVNDSSAQASPIGPTLKTPPTDASAEASPIDESHQSSGKSLPPHTTLRVVLSEAIDSSTLKNGQMVQAKLQTVTATQGSGTLRRANSTVWKAGTPVVLTVVGTVPAGKLNAVGEMSLELVRVGGQSVYTDTLTFRGQPGHRDLPDSAPMVGTNAGLAAGASLTFVVQPPPTFAEPTPAASKNAPGSVTAQAAGSKPANYGKPTVSDAPGSGAGGNTQAGTASGTTPQPSLNAGQVGVTPNQPASPTNVTPTSTTQPH